MGIMVYSLIWVMQDFDHQPYHYIGTTALRISEDIGFKLRVFFMNLPPEEKKPSGADGSTPGTLMIRTCLGGRSE